MTCGPESKSKSEERGYTFMQGDDTLGMNDLTNGFEEHSSIAAAKQDDERWDFNPNEALQARADDDYKAYRNSWNDKW